MSIQICVRLREAPGDDVDLDVLLAQQRVAGGEQEHRREQVPLDLEVGVRADVERLADDRVGGADQDRARAPARRPIGRSHSLMRSISARQGEQWRHVGLRSVMSARRAATAAREAPPNSRDPAAAPDCVFALARRSAAAQARQRRRSAALHQACPSGRRCGRTPGSAWAASPAARRSGRSRRRLVRSVRPAATRTRARRRGRPPRCSREVGCVGPPSKSGRLLTRS